MLKKLVITVVLFSLNACAYWPPEGRGGEAEDFATMPTYGNYLREKNRRMIDCFDREIQAMTAGIAVEYRPAKLVEMSRLWTRAIRAHSANFDREARQDLIDLSNELQQLKLDIAVEFPDEYAPIRENLKRSCT
ncbi:hypothetical protein [Curvivirga sp.]|uniref:hypothetical protein n=1 Tax=Curvivirga sp. TaxID=2856848 RepID=UPI003B5CC0C8